MWEHLPQIMVLVVVVAIGKGGIFALIVWLFRYGNIVPLAVGLGLFQIGEFAFVLARVGVSTGSISTELYSLILSAAIVTMILAPIISGQTSRIYALYKRWFKHEPLATMNLPAEGLSQHVVICGGGRVGLRIAQMLMSLNKLCVVIELDQHRVEQCKAAGIPVVYGDSSQEIILKAAQIESACLLLVTVPGIVTAQAVVRQARRLNQRLDIVARAEGEEHLALFEEMHVFEVVNPEFEASLEMTRQALLHLRLAPGSITQYLDTVRHELYEPLINAKAGQVLIEEVKAAQEKFDWEWLKVEQGSPAVGKTIGELEIRQLTGATIVGVSRRGLFTGSPGPEFKFEVEDSVALVDGSTGQAEIDLMFSQQ